MKPKINFSHRFDHYYPFLVKIVGTDQDKTNVFPKILSHRMFTT